MTHRLESCRETEAPCLVAEVNVTDRPWVARHLTTPESMVSSPRRRPLVYIYDLPAEFNTRMHQYRLDKVRTLARACKCQNLPCASHTCMISCKLPADVCCMLCQAPAVCDAENMYMETIQPVQQCLVHQFLDVWHRDGFS